MRSVVKIWWSALGVTTDVGTDKVMGGLARHKFACADLSALIDPTQNTERV